MIQLAREGRLDFFCITDSNTYLCAKDLNMTIKGLLAEIKADLHKYDDSGAIDTSSVYRWAEIALKRFGGCYSGHVRGSCQDQQQTGGIAFRFFRHA